MYKRIASVFACACALLLRPLCANPQGLGTSASSLPIKRVTLFTSGVSYTERAGPVTGSAEVPLTFHTAQINDILKSMILVDSSGKVQPATYASKDPVSRSLQSFAVDVSQNSSLEEILGRMRGAPVSITEAGKLIAEGSIVGIEKRDVAPAGKNGDAVEASFVTLMTNSGLTAVALDHSSVLYKRYVSELDAQETKIESLRQEAIRLRAEAGAAQLELRVFVDGITE